MNKQKMAKMANILRGASEMYGQRTFASAADYMDELVAEIETLRNMSVDLYHAIHCGDDNCRIHAETWFCTYRDERGL